MRRHIWARGAIGGGWLHQTRPVGKSTWSFLPTGLHPGTLKLATERVCPRGDTQFTLGTLNIYCLMILSVTGLCCCGGVSGCVSGVLPRCGVWASAALDSLWRVPGRALSLCGSPSQLLLGTWGPPGSQIKPVSPALAGRLFTTRETPYRCSLQNDIFLSSFTSIALTVTSNARVSLHTDSVSGETTAGVL